MGRRERPSRIPQGTPRRIACHSRPRQTGSLGGGVCHACGEMLEPVKGDELAGTAEYPPRCPLCGGKVDP
jgi:hypothetical protein